MIFHKTRQILQCRLPEFRGSIFCRYRKWVAYFPSVRLQLENEVNGKTLNNRLISTLTRSCRSDSYSWCLRVFVAEKPFSHKDTKSRRWGCHAPYSFPLFAR